MNTSAAIRFSPERLDVILFHMTGNSMRAVCLKHVPFEGPGAFAKALTARGVSLEQYLIPQDGLPKDAGDILIIMGGPMSVNDSDPWIAEETSFIRSALHAGTPVIGVCLGSQFMAKSLGATIRPGKALEIGMTPVTLTVEAKQDPVFRTLPESFEVFEWHGEVFDLPKDCVPLAGSDHRIPPSLPLWRSGLRASLSFGDGRERHRFVIPRMCARPHQGTPDRSTSESRGPPPPPATPSHRRSTHRSCA